MAKVADHWASSMGPIINQVPQFYVLFIVEFFFLDKNCEFALD